MCYTYRSTTPSVQVISKKINLVRDSLTSARYNVRITFAIVLLFVAYVRKVSKVYSWIMYVIMVTSKQVMLARIEIPLINASGYL